jgi:excisionase family DNA binding protein
MEYSELQSERLWTFEDVARFLALSEVHVRRMVSQGRIPSIKIGGARRFDPGEIRAWVLSHEDKPKEESYSG